MQALRNPTCTVNCSGVKVVLNTLGRKKKIKWNVVCEYVFFVTMVCFSVTLWLWQTLKSSAGHTHRSCSSPNFKPNFWHSASATDAALPDLRGWMRSCDTTPTRTSFSGFRRYLYPRPNPRKATPAPPIRRAVVFRWASALTTSAFRSILQPSRLSARPLNFH